MLWIDGWGEALRSSTLQKISQELDLQWQQVMADVVRDGVTAGEFQCPDPEATAWRLTALLDGLGLQVTVHEGLLTARSAAAVRAPGGRDRAGRPRGILRAGCQAGRSRRGVTEAGSLAPVRRSGWRTWLADVRPDRAANRPGGAHPRRAGGGRPGRRHGGLDGGLLDPGGDPPRPLPHHRLRPRHPRPGHLAAGPRAVVRHGAGAAGVRPPRHLRLLPAGPVPVARRRPQLVGRVAGRGHRLGRHPDLPAGPPPPRQLVVGARPVDGVAAAAAVAVLRLGGLPPRGDGHPVPAVGVLVRRAAPVGAVRRAARPRHGVEGGREPARGRPRRPVPHPGPAQGGRARDRRRGSAWFVVFGAWLVPHVAGGGTVYGGLYGDLGNTPAEVLRTGLAHPDRIGQRLVDNGAGGYARRTSRRRSASRPSPRPRCSSSACRRR